jgi:hypothetical protein
MLGHKDTAAAGLGREVGHLGTAVLPRQALVADAGLRFACVGWAADLFTQKSGLTSQAPSVELSYGREDLLTVIRKPG